MKNKITEFFKVKVASYVKEHRSLIKAVLIFIAVYVVVLTASYFEFRFTLKGDNPEKLNLNDEYVDTGCTATYYGKDIEYEINTDNLDNTKSGEYIVEYTATKWVFTRKLYRTITVGDYEGPTIRLNGQSKQLVRKGEKYVELGWTATDNVDKEVEVKPEGTVNTNEAGTYVITYVAEDSSKNRSERKRTVVVSDDNHMNVPVNEFWLNKIDDLNDIILEKGEEIDYFDDIVLIGDCNTYFLYSYNRLIKAEQCWGKSNLSILEINNSTFKTFVDAKDCTFDEAMDKYSPKYLIVNPGLASPLFMADTELFQSELVRFIEHMRADYPDTTFVFWAIMPLNDGQLSKEFQQTINNYNYLLAEICYNYNVKLINFADTVRGEDGYGIKENYIYSTVDLNDRGFHFEEKTRRELVDYLKHIDIRGEN